MVLGALFGIVPDASTGIRFGIEVNCNDTFPAHVKCTSLWSSNMVIEFQIHNLLSLLILYLDLRPIRVIRIIPLQSFTSIYSVIP